MACSWVPVQPFEQDRETFASVIWLYTTVPHRQLIDSAKVRLLAVNKTTGNLTQKGIRKRCSEIKNSEEAIAGWMLWNSPV